MVKLAAANPLRNIFRLFVRNIPEIGVRLLFLFVVVSLLAGGRDGLSQERLSSFRNLESDVRPAETVRVDVNEVDLSFLVTDRHYRGITDLSANEIRLSDNGEPPESIRFLQSRTGLPLRVGLLLDTSDSVAQQFAFEKEATSLFINQIIDPAKDLAFVLGFTDHLTLTQDFTSDTQVLAAGLHHLELGGGTAVYDAVDFACRKLMEHSEEGLSRRVLILLTDGDDNSSHITPRQFIQNATHCNAMVVVLFTELYPSESGLQVLKKLASETGGQVFLVGHKKQVTKAFQQLSEQLRSYYLLAYHPAKFNADGKYRKIELKTTRRGAHVVCRRGYYAASK